MDYNYTTYGDEWKREISKLPKKAIIEIASNIGKKNDNTFTIAQIKQAIELAREQHIELIEGGKVPIDKYTPDQIIEKVKSNNNGK